MAVKSFKSKLTEPRFSNKNQKKKVVKLIEKKLLKIKYLQLKNPLAEKKEGKTIPEKWNMARKSTSKRRSTESSTLKSITTESKLLKKMPFRNLRS